MKVSTEQLSMLKQHGFMWFKSQSTDRVDAECIKDVIPAANGFTVVYNTDKSVFELSTAEVEEIIFPTDPKSEWIRVVWKNIVDQRV